MARPRRQQRDEITLALPDGRHIRLLRVVDPRARRLRLLVTEKGVRLTIPPAATATEARHFLERHLSWLGDQLNEAPGTSSFLPRMPGESATLTLRGRQRILCWREAGWLHVRDESDAIIIAAPPGTTARALGRSLHDFLLGQARADVGRWLPHYLPGLPRAPRDWKIRPLTSLWGSLSSNGTMSLDLALILAPPAAFEYVLVHELCHLVQPNHSPAFWQEVEARLPDWRRQRRWLRDEGLELKRELRCLIA